MLIKTLSLYLMLLLNKIFALGSTCKDLVQNEAKNVTVLPFLDDNRYIRLNISWGSHSDEVFDTVRCISKTCNYIEEQYIRNDKFVIVPSLELIAPAEYLENDCEYEIIFSKEHNELAFCYKIPVCVNDKCKCDETNKSPYQLTEINNLHDNIYFIKWKKISNIYLLIKEIICKREDNIYLTHILENNITSEGVEVSLTGLKEDINYIIEVNFVSQDFCYYKSSINISLPSNNKWVILLELLVLLVFITPILILFKIYFYPLKSKLGKYISCMDKREDFYASTPLSHGTIKESVINPQYTPVEFEMNKHKFDHYEIPSNKVILLNEIGKGAFGVVWHAKVFELNNSPGYSMAAVKQLRADASDEEKEDLLSEIKILKRVGEHDNIVKLLACVTMHQPYMILLELLPGGSLKSYLQKLRERWSNRRSRFFFADVPSQEQKNFSRSISENLKYTQVTFDNSDSSYIQPDKPDSEGKINDFLLSNRYRLNSEKPDAPESPVSVTSSGLPSYAGTEITLLHSESSSPYLKPDYTSEIETTLDHRELQNFAVQIAKGMEYLERINVTHRDLAARNILMSNNKKLKISDFGLSKIGSYVSSPGKVLPLRWMAIEAIEQKIFNNKTDVWSYGVVLWEIGTLGAFPYRQTPNSMVLYDLKEGKRLEKPRICTEELYKLMLSCWSKSPKNRPTFYEIVKKLVTEQEKIYVDFSVLNPTYVFPSASEECN